MNLIEEVLKLDKEATGPWKNGKPTDAVIHEEPSAEPWGNDTHDYYGGALIAESISPTDKTLIIAYRTAAPKLARANQKLMEFARWMANPRSLTWPTWADPVLEIDGMTDPEIPKAVAEMLLAEIEKELAP